MRRTVLLTIAVLVVSACSGPDQTLEDTLWVLESIGSEELTTNLPASIAFAEGEVGGTTGCNTFGGPFRVQPDSDAISMGPFHSSLMSCGSEDLAVQERAMLASLESATAYEITVSGLQLKNPNDDVIATYLSLEPELAGTSWVVIGYNTGSASVRSVVQDTELSLAFDSAGGVTGSSGCNTFGGSFTVGEEYKVVRGQDLTITNLAATERGCLDPDGIMEQEAQYLAGLANSSSWRQIGSNLELLSSEGFLQVSAVPAS